MKQRKLNCYILNITNKTKTLRPIVLKECLQNALLAEFGLSILFENYSMPKNSNSRSLL